MTDPASPSQREAAKAKPDQEYEHRFGAMRAGIPLTIFEKLPWKERFLIRWNSIRVSACAALPRDYLHCCLVGARRMAHTEVWIPGPNVVVQTKAKARMR